MLSLKDVADCEKELVLLAGAQGLKAPVSQTHMVESLAIASAFIAPGELIFTTGAALRSEQELLSMVETAFRCGACGIVVNLGPYIRAIDPECISFAQSSHFPLFCCSWDVHMAEIMHRVSYRIEEEKQSQRHLATALQNALLRSDGWKSLPELGFPSEARYWMAATSTVIPPHNKKIFSFSIGNYTATVLWDIQKESIRALPHEGPVAVSASCALSELSTAFEEAKKLLDFMGTCRDILFWDEIGVCRLLLEIQDRDLLERYVASEVGALVQYESKKQNDLLLVLGTYLQCGGSLMEVSSRLGIHKNTVTNRIHKCETILGIDLSLPHIRRDIEVALLARQALRIEHKSES